MFLVPKYNKSRNMYLVVNKKNRRYNLFIIQLLLLLLVNSGSVYANSTLEIIGSITKGTCTISTPTQEVLFKKSIVTHDLKETVSDKKFTVPFSFKYHCQDFELSETVQTLLIKIKPSSGISINNNNVIYPTNNIVNAGFVLSSCDVNKENCHPIHFSSEATVPFNVIKNGELESQFEVSVVKLDSHPAKPGELVASVDLTLIQP